MMNKIKLILINKKIIIIGFIIITILVVYNLLEQHPPQVGQKITSPVLPKDLPELQNSYISDIFPKKTLIINWNNLPVHIPLSSKKYLITKPLVNKNTIVQLSSDLGFIPDDLIITKKETSQSWSNNEASLFTSLDQNQIIYSRKNAVLGKTSSIDKSEAISASKTIISRYFGETFLQTLDQNPTIRFLKIDERSYGPIPVTNPSTAEYIEIAYKQVVESFLLSSLSGNTNIITIVIDNYGNLYRLEIFGGYLELAYQGEQNLLDPNIFKNIASEKALKISSLSNISQESAYLNSTTVDVDVQNTFFGYFLASDNSVVPVVFVSGIAKSDQLTPELVTFVVPVGSL